MPGGARARLIALPVLVWLTAQDGRLYRLPTGREFQHAAYGGLDRPHYPWGNEEPAGQANYDRHGTLRWSIKKRYVAAWVNLDYRLWVGRNRGGGYASVYDRVLKEAALEAAPQ